MLDFTQYAARLSKSFEGYFDLHPGFTHNGMEFPLYCYYCSTSTKYMLTKKATLYSIDNFEHVLVKHLPVLDPEALAPILEYAKTVDEGLVHPNSQHMSSIITIALAADRVTDEAAVLVKKFKQQKSYKMALQGWSAVRLFAVDLGCEKVHSNREGKKTRAVFEAAFPNHNKAKKGGKL